MKSGCRAQKLRDVASDDVGSFGQGRVARTEGRSRSGSDLDRPLLCVFIVLLLRSTLLPVVGSSDDVDHSRRPYKTATTVATLTQYTLGDERF